MSRAGALLALALLGCAGTTPSSAFPRAGDRDDVTAALARMNPPRGPVNASGKPRAFLVVNRSGGSEVVAVDFGTGAVLWQERDEVGGRIVVARSSIAYARPDGTLVGRDLSSGAVLWQVRLPPGRRRAGYAADADAVYDVTSAAGDARAVELVRLDARSGSADWRRELEGEAGAPAVRGGVVALPRRSQYVSLIDGSNGRVLADILSREEAATFVRARPEGLFFGSRGIYLASAETATGARTTGYAQAKLPSFIRPTYDRDLYRAGEGDYSAVDRNRLLWRLDVNGGRVSFADGLVVAHCYRFFFGLDPATGELRWAHGHPREDAIASDLTAGHILFVAADGELGALDVRDGRQSWRAHAPVDGIVRGATLDVEGFAPPDDGAVAEPLAHALSGILWDPDKRFTEVKLYAVNELARLPGREVTVELLRALEASDLPPLVVQRATDALVDRRDPASLELYAAALKVRSDWAEDRRAPRLDVLARAVAVTKSAALVPPLLEHLRLPETDPAAVRDIADAALATESRAAVGPFTDYLLSYRADPGFTRAPGPLLAAADVLLKLGEASARATLLFVSEDARTIEPLRAYLRRALFPSEGNQPNH